MEYVPHDRGSIWRKVDRTQRYILHNESRLLKRSRFVYHGSQKERYTAKAACQKGVGSKEDLIPEAEVLPGISTQENTLDSDRLNEILEGYLEEHKVRK